MKILRGGITTTNLIPNGSLFSEDDTIMRIPSVSGGTPSTIYTNSDGNINGWSEIYDPSANHTLTDGGAAQRLGTSSDTNSYARYEYSGLSLTDFYLQVTHVATYFLGGTLGIQVGVHTNGTETTNQKGYWFQHAIGSGTWAVAGGGTAISWGTTSINNSCTIAAGSVIKITVTGSGATTAITIAVGGTVYYSVSNPSTAYNTGSFGIGTQTNYGSAYCDWDDYTVYGY